MAEEKYVIVEDGQGNRRRMPAKNYPILEKGYAEMRDKLREAGYKDKVKDYTLRIVKEKE